MKSLLIIKEFMAAGISQVGGKAICLAKIHEQGVAVPQSFCIPCRVYEDYLVHTRLKERILLEINRKPLEKMRWEEIWDISLRIRNLFLTTPVPQEMGADLGQQILLHCGDTPVAVRSSAPGEDGKASSFAGIHASFLNITGTDDIIKHVQLVWASLYSDAALLYRRELGLDIHRSQMAVVIQALVASDRSGIFFGMNPANSAESVVESVYGLNQALVDGDVEPDRWVLDRVSGRILSHIQPARNRYAVPAGQGVAFDDLPAEKRPLPPLKEGEVHGVWETGNQLETLFGRPQDMEWTFSKNRLVVLQARPITTGGLEGTDDKRSWYLSLHRSHENLKILYEKINTRLIPEMIRVAHEMGRLNFRKLSAGQLAREIERRQECYDRWVKVYWADFIPFAHGIRLFGQVYNDAVRPDDPYEFMTLLEKTSLKSIERNRLLERMAHLIQGDAGLASQLAAGQEPGKDHPFMVMLAEFIAEFGDLACHTTGSGECHQGSFALIRLILEFARMPSLPDRKTTGPDIQTLKAAYLERFEPEKKHFAQEVLELGRESFRLRDDDNIHLGRIEACLFEAVREGRARLAEPDLDPGDREWLTSVPALSSPPEARPESGEKQTEPDPSSLWLKARQVVGHPAGPGVAKGHARVVVNPEDLLDFKQGEVLICKGVDPNMTFVVPLSAAVVEERGGMLIHGAIIAREYGLPCVTGAPDIVRLVRTGDRVTVDGYLGIVTCETGDLD